MAKHRKKLPNLDEHLDLVPLIDCVFLLLLFFMLCGHLNTETRTEQITVPPTKTAAKWPDMKDWQRVIVNVFGKTQSGQPPRNTIMIGNGARWNSSGIDDYSGYQKLRTALNTIYDKADKYDAVKQPGLKLPKVIIELRADSETEYRVVQEVQQIMSDTIDPFNQMLSRNVPPSQLKCFVNVDFTTRKPGDKL